MHPQGDIEECERQQYNHLLETIGWFFFDLLLVGYVEDRLTGISFHLHACLQWTVYAEVSNYSFYHTRIMP